MRIHTLKLLACVERISQYARLSFGLSISNLRSFIWSSVANYDHSTHLQGIITIGPVSPSISDTKCWRKTSNVRADASNTHVEGELLALQRRQDEYDPPVLQVGGLNLKA
eukprot:1195514-Prorocentrum_minimum.AAC.3